MAKFDNIFKEETKKAALHPKRVTKWIHYSKLKDSKYQYRQGRTPEEKVRAREQEEALADLIDADGEVLEDLLVRKIDTDEYEIIAGHHRRNACKILVEERKKESYALLPCIIRNTSEVRTEFSVYSSNGYRRKTSYEIMCELEGMKHLLETYPEEFPNLRDGRMVEKLEKQLGMDKTTVGEYLTISKNLGERGMEKFQEGTLKKSAAVELAGLPAEEQEEVLDRGMLSRKEIKVYKHSRKAREIQKLQGEQEEEQSCLEIPEFKHREQWQGWLANYQKWNVWFHVPEADEVYYRYDLPDGCSIVICAYYQYVGQAVINTREYLLTPGYHYLNDCRTDRDGLIQHLEQMEKTYRNPVREKRKF